MEPMAFKRSAVRSRLSPPKIPENAKFSGIFLILDDNKFNPVIYALELYWNWL